MYAAASTDPNGMLIGGLIWAAAFVAYFTPSIIAVIRRVPNSGSVVVIDLLLGWTIIGWIVALAMAFGSKRPKYTAYPPPYNQPGYYSPQPQGWYPPQQPGQPQS